MVFLQEEYDQTKICREDVKEGGRKRSKKDVKEQKHNKRSKKDKVVTKRLLKDGVFY